MPALPSDVVRATRAAKIVTTTDSAVLALYPNARDGLANPEGGFFESDADAATVLALKKSLNGQRRRRFAVEIAGEVWIDPLTAIPSYRLFDSELDVDTPVMVCRVEVDMEEEVTRMEVIG